MPTDKIRKYILPNIPYLFIGWACLKLGTAYRLADGLPSGGGGRVWGKAAGAGPEHRPGLCRLCSGA